MIFGKSHHSRVGYEDEQQAYSASVNTSEGKSPEELFQEGYKQVQPYINSQGMLDMTGEAVVENVFHSVIVEIDPADLSEQSRKHFSDIVKIAQDLGLGDL